MEEKKIKQVKKKLNGRWNRAQQDRFMKGLEKYGRDWVKVQKVVKTRSITQIRSHAQKFFLKIRKQDIDALIGGEDYSEEEESFLEYDYNSLIQRKEAYSQRPEKRYLEEKNKQIREQIRKQIHDEVTNSSQLKSFVQLPSQERLPFSLEKSSSFQGFQGGFFLKCFLANADYFKNGGNFISLALQPEKPNQNGLALNPHVLIHDFKVQDFQKK